MAQCSYCGADTSLFTNGVPVCLTCASERYEKARVHQILEQGVSAAKRRAETASNAFDITIRDVPSGLPYPDGRQRIQNASNEYTRAREALMKAMERLGDFVAKGTVPDDLKDSNSKPPEIR